MVLEELEHAKARGAHIYAELVGYGATAMLIISHPLQRTAAVQPKLWNWPWKRQALLHLKYSISMPMVQVPITMTFLRQRQLRKLFGEDAKNLVINSTKSMIGHLLGAAGAVESIVSVKAIEEGFIHQTIGTKELGEGCDLNYAIDGPVEKDIQYAISNSLGFGGHNASLLFKKYEGQV